MKNWTVKLKQEVLRHGKAKDKTPAQVARPMSNWRKAFKAEKLAC